MDDDFFNLDDYENVEISNTKSNNNLEKDKPPEKTDKPSEKESLDQPKAIEHTERPTADTEHTEELGGRASAFSVNGRDKRVPPALYRPLTPIRPINPDQAH